MSFQEQLRGWLSMLAQAKTLAKEIEAYKRLNRMLDNYRSLGTLDFDEKAATVFQRLRKSRIRIGTMDLKIAAIALAHDATHFVKPQPL